MYQLDLLTRIRSQKALSLEWPARLDVTSTVWKLGLTSFFTDISSEMVSSILPLYFIAYLHFSPLEFGVLDGIYQGAAVALLSLAAGVFSDRWRRHKEVAVVGYALSAVSKLGLLALSGNWTSIAATLTVDRVGKGIRTAPRDAMISLSSRPESLGTSFAVHRSLDTGGAVFGPLLAFFLLWRSPGAFDLVLMTSFCVAIIGVGLIGLLVNRPRVPVSAAVASFQLSLGLWKEASFRVIVIAGALLALATASDGFIYLVLQKNTSSSASSFPLFAFVTASVYLTLSIPAGKLADKWGRRKVFLIGYSFVLATYAILLTPGLSNVLQYSVLGLVGIYYAATDGIIAAMTSAVLSSELRTSGLAVLNTVVSVSRLLSSVAFGWLWLTGAIKTPVWAFLAGLTIALIISCKLLVNPKSR